MHTNKYIKMESLKYFQEPEQDDRISPSTCLNCGSSKKRSPSSSLSPHPKREKHHFRPPNPTTYSGFTKLPLPATLPASFENTYYPALRRCTSDPVQLFPENVQVNLENSPVGTPEKLLPRSVSAPERDLVAATSGSVERLKRMKERMIEMSKWCDQVIAEGDEEDDEEVDHLVGAEVVNNDASKDDDFEGTDSEEAVSVEKKGESLIIHMKCPCSKAYQFLLSGNNCYYKLM